MDVVDLLKSYRLKRGISLNKLAEEANISSSTLSRIENRETEKLDYVVVMKLKSLLDVPDFELLMAMELYENESLNNMFLTDLDANDEYQCNVCAKYYKGTLVKDLSLGHRNQLMTISLCKACRRRLISTLLETLD